MKIFSKMLTKTDVRKGLLLKTKSLQSFPPFKDGRRGQVLKVMDRSGKEWQFRLVIRMGRYKKPLLSGGWRKFSTSMKLEIGDEVLVFKEGEEATGVENSVYKIIVKKPVKLFNARIGYQP